jgi:hypothetical protein
MSKPTTIDECMIALTEVLGKEDQEEIVKMAKDDLITLHHGLGRWIRNNWDLWAGGSLKDHMTSLGFMHPDDMSQSIIVEYWNRMNHKPSDLEANIQHYKEFWEKNGS